MISIIMLYCLMLYCLECNVFLISSYCCCCWLLFCLLFIELLLLPLLLLLYYLCVYIIICINRNLINFIDMQNTILFNWSDQKLYDLNTWKCVQLTIKRTIKQNQFKQRVDISFFVLFIFMICEMIVGDNVMNLLVVFFIICVVTVSSLYENRIECEPWMLNDSLNDIFNMQ